MHREAASSFSQEDAQGMSESRKNIAPFDEECILNVEETGLFFKLLPGRIYFTYLENAKFVLRTKVMWSKDRIMAYFCTNVTGDKVPMKLLVRQGIIGVFVLLNVLFHTTVNRTLVQKM